MSTFKPIRQPRVSEEVILQLKQAFIVGHFKAGDKLPPEREMAKEFQVSRVAIREALRALEGTGFVTIKQGATGGAYVTDLNFETLSNAFVDLFLAEKISVPELCHVRRGHRTGNRTNGSRQSNTGLQKAALGGPEGRRIADKVVAARF